MPKSVFELIAVSDEAERHRAESLDREYLNWIAETALRHYHLSLDVEAMLKSDIEDMTKFYPPAGRFYLLKSSGEFVGIGCLKRLGPEVAELQRMYVQPRCRGLGGGRALLNRLLDDARAIGYRTVRLESLKVLAPAHSLYHSAGFKDINRYQASGMEACLPVEAHNSINSCVYFMEMALADPARPA